MRDYPASRRCGRCAAPALYRLALVDADAKPSTMLARRSHYRCADCFTAGFTPEALGSLGTGQTVVVDPAFTAAVAFGRCLCGLPADHRYPEAGEPRACIDETVRITRTPALSSLVTEPSGRGAR